MAKKAGSHKTEKRQIWLRRVRIITRVLLVLLVVVSAIYGFFLLTGSETLNRQFQLANLDLHGTVHVETDQLRTLIESTFPSNTLSVDLDRLRNLVEAEVWVESATVRRTLPNRISVFIHERRPFAIAEIDEGLRVVDREGVLLAPHGAEFQSIDRPIVKGLKNVAVENAREDNARKMGRYLQLLSELDSDGNHHTGSISEVIIDDEGNVSVVPEDEAFRVNLGADRFLEHYQVYLTGRNYLQDLKQQQGAIESVDVTYNNKIVVRRHKAEESEDSGGE